MWGWAMYTAPMSAAHGDVARAGGGVAPSRLSSLHSVRPTPSRSSASTAAPRSTRAAVAADHPVGAEIGPTPGSP